MSQLSNEEEIQYLISNLAVIQDFPKPGIVFRDTLSLFNNPATFQRVIDLFANHIKSLDVDAIVGLEARGFILGGAIAYKLNLPFVPIRKVWFEFDLPLCYLSKLQNIIFQITKKGKLAGKTISVKYDLEYGQDEFEVQQTALKEGQRVAIVDDVIATGGRF